MDSQARRAAYFPGTEFNEFLFAPVGVDRHGGQLSVISALSRLDIDARAEAASLARLPGAAATAKLGALLNEVAEFPQTPNESQRIAVRLVALLPHHGVGAVRPSAPRANQPGVAGVGFATLLLFIILAMMVGALVLLVGMQISAVVGPAPPPPAATAPAPSINNVLP